MNQAMNVNIGFISLGCAKNQVDLEKLAGTLEGRTFNFTDKLSECDVVIVNTCGFIAPAVSEAVDAILDARAKMPKRAKLIAFGCMMERYKGEISKELPEIDFVAGVGSTAQSQILEYLHKLYPDETNVKQADIKHTRYLLNSPYYAYLKISEGCDNHCTYCTIPLIHGGQRSVPANELVAQTAELVANGTKEIIVVGQDTSKYGSDMQDGTNLAILLGILAKNFPQTYFRIMYINPDGVTDELIKAIKAYKNILHYFDIPIQHASDRILKKMARRSDSTQIKGVFKLIRKLLPDSVIRTTLIVGFPTETDDDIDILKNFLEEYKPDYAGFFPYSPEEGTVAEHIAGRIDDKTIKMRLKALQSVQKKITMERLKQFKVGEITCFIERASDDFSFILEGRTLFQAPDVDGKMFVIDSAAIGEMDGAIRIGSPYRAKIQKIAYPDVYVKIIGAMN
ncbi:30S ribosomal protein S12 methylthiotransferase RimO [Deferribacterales bacterium RsTz2092]